MTANEQVEKLSSKVVRLEILAMLKEVKTMEDLAKTIETIEALVNKQ